MSFGGSYEVRQLVVWWVIEASCVVWWVIEAVGWWVIEARGRRGVEIVS